MMATFDRAAGAHLEGRYIYANDGGDNGARNIVAGNNELWGALAEKAYAQLNESNKISQDGTNSYGGINGGWPDNATTHITGIAARRAKANHNPWHSNNSTLQALHDYNTVSDSELRALVNSNKVVTLWGFDSSADGGYVGETNVQSGIRRHAYAITGYNPTNGRYTIRNPHDRNHLSFTYAQLRELNATIGWSNS